MEDYNTTSLHESQSEWSIYLMNYLTPSIIDGFRNIFQEAVGVCNKMNESSKYLMTFQNFISRIPSWNETTIQKETECIIKTTKCPYLGDLVSCIHIIEVKILSCVRTNNHNARIEIDIPSLESFIHSVYINVARKLYKNIYLFDYSVPPLEQQKNRREIELIVQSCIMNTIRESIPVDKLLRQYMDETQEFNIHKVSKVVSSEPIELSSKPEDIEAAELDIMEKIRKDEEEYNVIKKDNTGIEPDNTSSNIDLEEIGLMSEFDNMPKIPAKNNQEPIQTPENPITMSFSNDPVEIDLDELMPTHTPTTAPNRSALKPPPPGSTIDKTTGTFVRENNEHLLDDILVL